MENFNGFIKLNKEKSLDNYYHYQNIFTEEEYTKLSDLLKDLPLEQGKVGTSVNLSYRSSKIKWLPMLAETRWLYEKLFALVQNANDIMWDFNILGMGELIQYGEYAAEENGHYDWHLDLGSRRTMRKISVTIQLSEADEYEGGELQFMVGKEPITVPKGKGVTIVFPSYFLHRVTPVTKGKRKSLVVWVYGNPLA